MLRGLRNIEGCIKVEKIDMKERNRTFVAAISEKTKPDFAGFSKTVGRALTRVDLSNLIGEVGFDDKTAWVTCRTSGAKVWLSNRVKRSDYDAPPDLISEIKTHIKEGRTTLRLSGEFKAEPAPGTVHLADATPVTVDKEKKEK